MSLTLSQFVQMQMQEQHHNFARSVLEHVLITCAERFGGEDWLKEAKLLFEDFHLDEIKAQPVEAKKRATKAKAEPVEKVAKAVKAKVVKPGKVPPNLPFMPELVNEALCDGLTTNNRMFTQCKNKKCEDSQYCKRCEASANENGGIPSLGNVELRAANLFDYATPKDGTKMISYSKVMSKLKPPMTRESAQELASEFDENLVIGDEYFDEEEVVPAALPIKKSAKVELKPTSAPNHSADTNSAASLATNDANEEVADLHEEKVPVQDPVVVVIPKPSSKKGKKSAAPAPAPVPEPPSHIFDLEDGSSITVYLNEANKMFYKTKDLTGDEVGEIGEDGEPALFGDECDDGDNSVAGSEEGEVEE